MADANVFQIEDGVVGLVLVNTAEVGYLPTWQGPEGVTLTDAVIADYDAESDVWSCNITSGMLTPRANDNDITVEPTFCAPSRILPNPGETSFSLDVEWYQDIHVSTGLSKFLRTNDTLEAYFFLGLNGADPPKAIGRVRIQAGAFGGKPRTPLKSTLSLKCTTMPDMEFGDATTSVIVTLEEMMPARVAAKARAATKKAAARPRADAAATG